MESFNDKMKDGLSMICILEYTEDTYPETLTISRVLGVYNSSVINNAPKLLDFLGEKF